MKFQNQVLLIVGASSGIGRAVALKLATAGAKLVVTARRRDRLESLADEISENGGECLALAADAFDERAAECVVESTVERFGRIDVALLNAGGAPAIDMRTMSAAAVKSYMRTNYDVTVNYLFPPVMRWLIRIAQVLPKPLVNRILEREVPLLDEVAAGPAG